MKNFNECVDKVRGRIDNLNNGYTTSQEQRLQCLSEIMKNTDERSHQIYLKSNISIDESIVDELMRLLEIGIQNIGHLATDVEIEKILSFEDTYSRLDPLKDQISNIRTEIQRAYTTVLFMLGYDCIQASILGLEQLRSLTIRAVINEFLHELFDMADAMPRDDMHFIIDTDDMSKQIYLPDINGVMDMILDAYKAKH